MSRCIAACKYWHKSWPEKWVVLQLQQAHGTCVNFLIQVVLGACFTAEHLGFGHRTCRLLITPISVQKIFLSHGQEWVVLFSIWSWQYKRTLFVGASNSEKGIGLFWIVTQMLTLAERTNVEWCNFEINRFGSRAEIFSGIKRSEEMESWYARHKVGGGKRKRTYFMVKPPQQNTYFKMNK